MKNRLLICCDVRLPGLKVRRSQMSAVFQAVRIRPAVFGGLLAPKPAVPFVQAESLKLVTYQFDAGVVKVYFQLWPLVCDVGTIVVSVTGVPAEATAARMRSASGFRTRRSYASRPFNSLSTSVICV